jgi:predicted regulator of Ras-like GTPase activity (Roadblock/LC7/MglB family)
MVATQIAAPVYTAQPTSREEALTRALSRLPRPDLAMKWAALMDYDGLMLANYPQGAQLPYDELSAATGHLLLMVERVQSELEIGKWRYTLTAGAQLQILVIALNKECVLALGMGSRAPLASAFAAIRDIAPDLIRDLEKATRKYSETNTIIWRPADLKEMH